MKDSRITVTINQRHTFMMEADILGLIVFGSYEKEFKVIHAVLFELQAGQRGKFLPAGEAGDFFHELG